MNDIDREKVSRDAEHYRKEMLRSFGMSDTPGAGKRAKELYEAGMKAYLADPVAPIIRRHEIFLKKLLKNESHNYGRAVELTNEIEKCLQHIVEMRATLLWIAQDNGIKLKRGIVI